MVMLLEERWKNVNRRQEEEVEKFKGPGRERALADSF